MKKCVLLVFCTLATIVFFNACTNSSTTEQNVVEMEKQGLMPVNANVFKTDKGWGYSIIVNNKLFIRQDIIPAVEGNKGFATKEDATKVAELVLNKLKNKEKPIVKKEELKQLGIIQ